MHTLGTYNPYCSATLNHTIPYHTCSTNTLCTTLLFLRLSTSVGDREPCKHCPTYRGGSGRTPSPGWGMCSFSGRLRPRRVVPSCTPDYASIPSCFHGDAEKTFTATAGWGYTCPCSCPCCLSPCLEGVSLKSSLEHWTSQDGSGGTVALRQSVKEGFTLLSSFTFCSSLSCPAVTGCRLSWTQCFSCLLSSLGVWCECTPDAKTVCVCMCVSESSAVLACLSINLSPFLPLSFFSCHILSISVFPSHTVSLSCSPSLCLSPNFSP